MDAELLTERTTIRPTRQTIPALFGLGLLLIFVAIVWMARANALTFPLPNDDESAFFLPAWYLAVHGTLRYPMLNAPDGIFWTPHGFYIWQALFLRIFGPTIDVSRTLCQVSTASAAVLLTLAYSRIARSRAFALLCGALLVSPGVIFCANMVRMEALTMLILAIGLLLFSYRLRLAAAATFFLGVTVHPELLMGATLFAVGLIVAETLLSLQRRSTGISTKRGPEARGRSALILTVLVVALVALAIGVEGIYTLRHLATFHQHMAYQIARKMGRSPIESLQTKRGVAFLVEGAFAAILVWRARRPPTTWNVFVSELLPVLFLIMGVSAYATFGREIPYNVYSYAVVPATIGCLTYRLLTSPGATGAATYG
jgi:hypothetical protein